MKNGMSVVRLLEIFMKGIVFSIMALFVLEANAMEIDARDAQAEMGRTTMTLKRVHSGGSDYVFHLSWNPATNSWVTDSYEPDHGYGWRPEAKMPSGTYWAGSAVAGNKLYIIGGSSHWDKLSIYNPQTNTWSQKTVSRMGFLLRAATVSNNVYIFDTSVSGDPGWIYSLKTLTMSDMGAVPPNLEWTSEPAVYNGKVYFFGGYGPLKTAWKFDPSTLAFSKLADMPTAGYGSSTAVVNGKIYVIGGNYRANKVEIYDPKTNAWAPSLAYPGLSLYGWDIAAPLGSKIAIVEAETGNTFLFNPASKFLTTQETMPTSHGDYLTGESLGGRLYVAGGQSAPSSLDSFKPDPATSAVAMRSPMSETEILAAPQPDYKAVEAGHQRRIQQLRLESHDSGNFSLVVTH